jgi:hypothetical protein
MKGALMGRGPKDAVATALVAALVLVYAAYVVFDGLPFVRDATGMAGLGLILGFASRRIGGRSDFVHERAAFTAGLAVMAVGAAALATGSELVLAVFVLGNVALWAAAARVRGETEGGRQDRQGSLR